MPALVLAQTVVALVIWLAGFAVFGRFIAPPWKVWGKLVFFVAISAALSAWIGRWALIWIIGHPALGVAGHIGWCRKHSINWLTCEPRDRYLALRPWARSDRFAAPE